MQRSAGKRIVPGLVILLAAMAAEAAGPAPPARPPRQKLTLWDKEVYEGRRVLVDEDCYPRKPARLTEVACGERAIEANGTCRRGA